MKKLLFYLLLFTSFNLAAQLPNYVPSNDLVGWWPFTGNANDESVNNYNLTNNSVTFGDDRNNNAASAAYFSGNSSYLISQSTFSQFTSSPEQAYSFWFKNVQSNWRYLMNYANASTTRFSIVLNTLSSQKEIGVVGSSGCLNCGVGGGFNNFNSPGLDIGWHHIAVTISLSTYSVYYDGTLISTELHAGFNCIDSTFRFILGNDILCAPEYYNMYLDDIAVWNRSLTECEIQDLYNAGNSIITSTDNQTACDTYTWIDGNTYTTSNNTATHTVTNAAGCDSTVTLDLTINNSTSSFDTLSVTASIVWNGMPLNVSGDYSVTLINSAGCDSITNLNLTVSTTPTWDCVGNACVDPGTGLGAYSTIAACQGACMPVSIQEHTTNKALLKVTDLLGRETKGTNQPLFYIYDDGTVEKRIVIKQ